jgi:hypothetical protein
MADKKISDLTAITGANTADDDLLVIVDTSAGETKRITLGELENGLARSNFALDDNEKITFGAGSDLQIYHSGTTSVIADVGTGYLDIRGTNLFLQNADASKVYLSATDGAEVSLKYNNSEKLATTSTGIDVTGTVTADGLTVEATSANLTLLGSTDGTINFGDAADINIGQIYYDHASNYMRFKTADTERMRIDSSGNLLVGKTSLDGSTDGLEYDATFDVVTVTRNGGASLYLNRRTSDGDLAVFRKDGTTVGSIGSNSGLISYINLDPRSGGTGVGATNTDSVIPVTGTGAVADGTKDLGISNSRWRNLYLSGGVYLGGTGSANHLDDYEEGTWTPVARGRTSSGTGTYTRQAGYYTKVGKLVTANFDIGWSAHTGTGGLEISLPFTVSGTGYQGGAYLTYNSGLSYSYNMIHGWMDNGGSYVRIWQTNTSGASSNVPMDTSVSELHFTVVYTATD